MTDWIFEGSPRHEDLGAALAMSREHRWSTPRYREQTAVDDRVWLQVTGPHRPGIYYVARITRPTYEITEREQADHERAGHGPAEHGSGSHEQGGPGHSRWRTDIRFDYAIEPPLLRAELLDDAALGSFRPFHGFQGSTAPLPPEIASALAERAAPRLVPLDPSGGPVLWLRAAGR
jgi:hypothetical protein